MHVLTPGLASISFRKLRPAEVVKLVGETSLRSIEWGGDIHVPHGNLARAVEVETMSTDAGLQIASYASYYRIGSSEAEGLPFSKVLETAIVLKAPGIRVWAGTQGSAATPRSQRGWIVDEARRIAALAATESKTIYLEYRNNTLTDSSASCLKLLEDIGHPNIKTYWQPPNGRTAPECASELEAVLPHLANIHVFHRWPAPNDRMELSEGTDQWNSYLNLIRQTGKHHHLLLEFIKGGDPDIFVKDATTLCELLEMVSS